jgi:MSHA biogenesis protein MshJ
MKRYWTLAAARIDEMTLRQRGMLFATLSLVLIVVAHVLFIEPVLLKQKQLIERVNRDQSQLSAVRSQIEAVVKDQATGRKNPELAALLELEARIAATERAAAERKQGFVAPTRLPALVRSLLGPGHALRMESLRVVPGAPVEGPAGFYRHGVELTLKGSYFDLVQYLMQLERLPARLIWGRTELAVDQYPEVRLTANVWTLSTQPALGL